jgi:prepilin-type N-terminal cleavage/methylation domain-containing protein
MSTPRKGFSLIEIMVAMVILSVVLLSLAKISIAMGTRTRSSDVVAKRTAALQLEANKLGVIPFGNLATWPTAPRTISLGSFQYRRRLTITAAGPSRFTMKVVVVPMADSTKGDSIMFDRTRPPTGTPLCTVGC